MGGEVGTSATPAEVTSSRFTLERVLWAYIRALREGTEAGKAFKEACATPALSTHGDIAHDAMLAALRVVANGFASGKLSWADHAHHPEAWRMLSSSISKAIRTTDCPYVGVALQSRPMVRAFELYLQSAHPHMQVFSDASAHLGSVIQPFNTATATVERPSVLLTTQQTMKVGVDLWKSHALVIHGLPNLQSQLLQLISRCDRPARQGDVPRSVTVVIEGGPVGTLCHVRRYLEAIPDTVDQPPHFTELDSKLKTVARVCEIHTKQQQARIERERKEREDARAARRRETKRLVDEANATVFRHVAAMLRIGDRLNGSKGEGEGEGDEDEEDRRTRSRAQMIIDSLTSMSGGAGSDALINLLKKGGR